MTVAECKVERLSGKFDFITARAVARLDKLFGMAWHLAHRETKWVLPKGESAKSELDEAMGTWQGRFSLVPSRTHPCRQIVIDSHKRKESDDPGAVCQSRAGSGKTTGAIIAEEALSGVGEGAVGRSRSTGVTRRLEWEWTGRTRTFDL